MKRERLWFGTAMIVVPVLLLLLALSPGIELTRSGPVEGHVSFHGRPLSGGSILFVPEEEGQGDWALARIDENGHYVIGSIWARKASSSKTRYRICLMPNSHHGASKTWHGAVLAAWSGPGAVAFPPPDASSGFPAQFYDPKTTRLQVRLGSEPARIDVAL